MASFTLTESAGAAAGWDFGPKLIKLNAEIGFHLKTEAEAQEYLRLFCAYVWGDLGSFSLVESDLQLPKQFKGQVKLHPVRKAQKREHEAEKYYYFEAFVRYGYLLWHAVFRIEAGDVGAVKMLDDQ